MPSSCPGVRRGVMMVVVVVGCVGGWVGWGGGAGEKRVFGEALWLD